MMLPLSTSMHQLTTAMDDVKCLLHKESLIVNRGDRIMDVTDV